MCGRRDVSLVLDDVIDAAERLVALCTEAGEGLGLDRAINDQVLWNLTVIGEASKRLTTAVRERYDDVAWSGLARMRDRVVHHYEGVDWATVEKTLTDDLPRLLPRLREIRDELRAKADAAG